jgi:hypothetical protein
MLLRGPEWAEFWDDLGLTFLHFENLGLAPAASDCEVWLRCQAEALVLIIDNRNHSGPESLEATLRALNMPGSLPAFTLADVDKFNNSRAYADLVAETLLDYLQRIEELRGSGRLYLP